VLAVVAHPDDETSGTECIGATWCYTPWGINDSGLTMEAEMATMELTRDNFETVLDGSGLVLVDFWAGWCGPCRMFGPVFERVSERHPDAVFGKVDTEAQPELAGSFGISSIPTLVIIRDKIVLYAQPGALPEPALEQLITRASEIDMDEIRVSLAAGAPPTEGQQQASE
jgi:thioredoxin 1